MEIVIYIAGAVIFFALVMASIALHEVGHLVPGKLFGVKTTQYFVGFGRTLWSRRLGRDRVRLQAVPLGGYVRFVGMFPPAKNHPARSGRTAPGRSGRWPTTPGPPSGRHPSRGRAAGCSTRRSPGRS